MSQDIRVKTSIRNFLIALVLLLLTNIVTSATLVTVSKHTLREQIEQRMLDVSNIAADALNGDFLATVQKEDVGSPNYEESLRILREIYDNIELSYIYCVRSEGDKFIYIMDPDPENPALFGEEIQTTSALLAASEGTASVDKKPHEDEWGRFYSAYSPVFDSQGSVTGIIGVDFNADWYDQIVYSNRAIAIILTMVALMAGIALSFMIMSQNRKKFFALLNNLERIDFEAQKLDYIIMQSSIKKLDMLPDSESQLLKTLAAGEKGKKPRRDEYEEMNTNLESVYQKLRKYLEYVDEEVYTDDTTGVNNKAAYKQRIETIDKNIKAGNADFSAAFFDINGLKKIYTYQGFEAGDKLMFECAKLLKEVFGKQNVYHITGDEFIALVDGKSELEMKRYFAKFDEKINNYNTEHEKENHLSVAKGMATYHAEKHSAYRHVFTEAKADCDRNKAEYYEQFRK